MKRTLITLMTIFLFCVSSVARESAPTKSYSAFEQRITTWLKGIQPTSQPDGAKQKTIDYPNFNYRIYGYFSKGILTEGQYVYIYDTANDLRPIIEGKVSYWGEQLKVKGIKYDYTESEVSKTYGTFYLSNTADNQFIYKHKKADYLNIIDVTIDFYSGKYLECPTIVQVSNEPHIAVDGKTGGRGYEFFSAPLTPSSITKIGYNNPYELLTTVNNGAYMSWTNGHSFSGTVKPEITDKGTINFVTLYGEKTGYTEGYQTIKVYEKLGLLYMELTDNPANRQIKNEIVEISEASNIPENSLWDIRYFYDNMKHITWEYRNGDLYTGEAVCQTIPSEDGKSYSISTTITNGEFKYANGDSFIGNLSGETFYGTPIDGTTKFKDGSTEVGNWLAEYSLTNQQYSSLSSYRYPSTIRDSAIVYRTNNLYDSHINAAKKAEYDREYSLAKKHYLAAKEIKPEAEKFDEIIKDLDQKIKKEEYRRMLIKKYGITIGDKLAEGIIEIGMTKDMVVDALGYDDIVLHSYRISNSMDWNDNVIEIWEYDSSKAKQYMDKEMEESAALLNLYLSLASSMGFDYKSEISKSVTYKYMKFKNNRLVEVKDSSIYDDIDRSSGSLYNSFWF